MRFLNLMFILFLLHTTVHAQLTLPANGGSLSATTGETIGITDVTIKYGRPAVRGREGEIWGKLVHEGFEADQSFGKKRNIPWRAGANENTTMEFSTDVMIEGKKLKAGKYGFHIAYHPNECILIFSKNSEGWGSYYYDEADDALRVKVKPVAMPASTERLTYAFSDQTDSTAVISLMWEKLSIPFTVATKLHELQMASIEKEMNSTKSFDPQTYLTAANYYLEHNVKLEDALEYSRTANRIFRNFTSAYLQHNILKKMGKNTEADSVLNASLKTANMNEVNRYGYILMREKSYDKAMSIFKMNHDKYPDTYITNLAMTRCYSAMGEYKKAIKYADKAKMTAPSEDNKKTVETMIATLKEGKDINS